MIEEPAVRYRYRFVTDSRRKPNSQGYDLRSRVVVYSGPATWYFAYVPVRTSKEIKNRFGISARGWGSLPVEVTAGKTTWITSIFPDKKLGMYILPLKAQVRQKEGIKGGAMLSFKLRVITRLA